MYEVELKAWLDNKSVTENKLKDFATFDGFFEKQDTYYHLDSKNITVRIREEKITHPDNSVSNQILVTYKKKQTKVSQNNETYEVNLEKEFNISAKEDFQDILFDSGYEISLQKHKSVSSYYANIENSKKEKIQCHIELCYIEKLGNFIEIETLTEDNSEENTSMLKEVLVSILNMVDIPISKIEKRYYKEMLKNVWLRTF